MKRIEAEKIKRVVVRGTNWVGDAVMTVPALRELRRLLPDAHITLATRSWAKGLFEGAEFLDELLLVDAGNVFQQARQWQHRQFDLAILFQNAFEAALISFLGRARFRLGYAKQRRSLLLTQALPLPSWRDSRHESFYYLNIIAELDRLLNGKSDVLDREPVFDLTVSDDRKVAADKFLRSFGVRDGRQLIALCPGSINSRAKRWPAERYAVLADRLIDALGADVLLIGSADEVAVSHDVSSRMRHEAIVLTGKTDLAQAVAILSMVDLLITNDTGPAHLASALGRPTLVIFGPTNPLTTRPFSSTAQIVRHPPDCAPCMLRDCPIDHRCMTAISPDEVFDCARQMIDTGSHGSFVSHRSHSAIQTLK
jgi:heptosyltransferase II